jgi:hypothetical protein
MTELHDWRVRSAHLVVNLGTHDKSDACKRIIDELVQMLGSIAPLTEPAISHNGAKPEVYKDARDLVVKAAKLDKIFRMSRAHFHVFITRVKLPLAQPPSFGFKFDGQTMECSKELPLLKRDGPPVVDLAISPGIFKAGNADGKDYRSERVLVKLQALCNLQKILELLDKNEVADGDQHDKKEPYIKQEH